MDITTTRFGTITIEREDVMTFVDGLIGMEDCRQWALLADAENDALGWLQCLDRPEVALAVVSPRRFVQDYQVRVARRDIVPLGLPSAEEAQVLVILNQVNDNLMVNLKAPLVIYAGERIGRQIVAKDDHAVQHPIQGKLRLRRTG
ncbi:MAG TPA: flagellar assembly protein FliW [Planctomycetaceae bacterium]